MPSMLRWNMTKTCPPRMHVSRLLLAIQLHFHSRDRGYLALQRSPASQPAAGLARMFYAGRPLCILSRSSGRDALPNPTIMRKLGGMFA